MFRSTNDRMLAGVIGGIAESLGTGSGWLRVIFLVLYLGIGGLTFGISAGAVTVIYILCWMFIPER
jgi:phage shock protein PspC (stress-responsive transcriptional regulator)